MTGRHALAALVIMVPGIAAAHPATARAASHAVRENLVVSREPGPGTGGAQVIRGGRADGGQHRSGAGWANQNLTGSVLPSFVIGQAQQPVAKSGTFDVQGVFCGSQPGTCDIGQNMPLRRWT